MLSLGHRGTAKELGAMALAVVALAGNRPDLLFADAEGHRQATPQGAHTTVLFMCPHGAAKSVLASAYFKQAAKERGLNVRVDAVGIEPQEAVSTVVKEHLERSGYAVPVAKPRAVTKDDLERADVVISLGCDLSHLPASPRSLQKWDEVPGPGEDFKAADEAIRRRVMALVEELVAKQKK